MMMFKQLSTVYDKLENTTKRLEIVDIIKELLETVAAEEIKPVVYMTSSTLGPDYDELILGIKIQTMKKILSEVTGLPSSKISDLYREYGDLGDVAFNNLNSGVKQSNLDDFFGSNTSKNYSIMEIWNSLITLSEISGKDSNRKKAETIALIMQDLEPIEVKYFVRIIVANMRLGANAPTFLAATADILGDEDARDKLDRAYYFTSDLGLIISDAINNGINSLNKYHQPKPGVPVKCMAAEREKDTISIFERLGDKVAVEKKYDGYRVQIHIFAGKVELYSRNQESYTDMFPDLIEPALSAFKSNSTILEGEIVAYDYSEQRVLPFQQLTTRSRKYDISEIADKNPVKVYLFDILYLNGKDLTNLSFPERRENLEQAYTEVEEFGLAELVYTSNPEELDQMLIEAKSHGSEGLMVKDIRPNSIYQAGGRGFGWIKYKVDYLSQLSDTFDLVIVGAYYGRGKRTGTFGTLLMAAWNENVGKYQTFCKVGTGLSDELLDKLTERLDELIISNPPTNLEYNETPDEWIKPEMILEIEGAEITNSPVHTVSSNDDNTLSLRFPRFIRLRDDKPKAPEGCTTVTEINKINTT